MVIEKPDESYYKRYLGGSEIRAAMEWFQNDIGVKKYRTALIGPSGENGVHLANIIADCRHAFGRCGLGAVMGSKRLKGVVVKGSQQPVAADTEKILALNRIMKEKYKNSPFKKYGADEPHTTWNLSDTEGRKDRR